MVPMEREHFQGTTVHHPAAEAREWVGRVLLYFCLQTQSTVPGTLTVDWFRKWNLQILDPNPPQIQRIPANIKYMRLFAMEGAYITPQQKNETNKAYKCRIYDTMITLLREKRELPIMRISRLWATTDWTSVWSNLHGTPVPEDIKMDWYRAIHDIIPAQDRLNRINMAATNLCRHCNATDNLSHRLIECGEGQVMWDWTRERLATVLRTKMRLIPDGWLVRPTLSIWPPKGRRAVLWILANFVAYRLHQRHTLTCHDYYNFLRRAKWKLQQATRWHERVGNYLRVLTEVPPQWIAHT